LPLSVFTKNLPAQSPPQLLLVLLPAALRVSDHLRDFPGRDQHLPHQLLVARPTSLVDIPPALTDPRRACLAQTAAVLYAHARSTQVAHSMLRRECSGRARDR
jgi:hypothetical protein